MTRVLVTGAGGMLGRAVAAAARAAGHEPIGLDRARLDVTDARAARIALARARPDAVVNCAAWTDVDGAEADPGAARAVNADGAGHLAAAAAALGAKLVHVSTDYVFAGDRNVPYVESDAPAPRCAYGETKRAGELAALAADPGHVVVRSAWLFGPGGPNFVATILDRARAGEALRVVDDQTGCPTYSGHLAEALVALAARPEASGIFHVAGAGACSWHALAVEALRQAAIEAKVEPVPTGAMPRPARRPAFSALRSERADAPRLPAWQDGLAAYLTATHEPVTR